ncbi:peptidylprolyl isomerase [Kordiimonas sp. SCSIO 12610]|uniref:peptidylprolyl isomerase n=1 Tax=Kordiimonas sp. SCSIO 12610 TaxID=2829597 RepID=UPI00210CD1B5|nr:peptidylprolyl isomerase [Kordiimonas sp. SCSIO 12610]UTW54967.1 peptidylprolyl isomerase [Kordiimonas sp. SCSIO 12610]
MFLKFRANVFVAVILLLNIFPSLSTAQDASESLQSSIEPDENGFIDYEALMFEAADDRDGINPVFEEALKAGYIDALWHWGQIGTPGSCQKLARYLNHNQNDVKLYAASGAAMCMENISTPALVLQINRERDPLIKGELYRALGYTGRVDVRSILINAISSEKKTEALEGALEGLMQNIVYAGVKAGDLPNLDYQKLIKLTYGKNAETTALRAAYLLTRMNELEAFLTFSDFESAFDKAEYESVKLLLLRAIGRVNLGAGKVDFLLSQLSGNNPKYRQEAIAGLGALDDVAATTALLAIVKDKERATHERQAAIAALNVKVLKEADLKSQYASLLKSLLLEDNDWINTQAMRGLVALDKAKGEALAFDWLSSDNYYYAFHAMARLAASEEGRNLLKDFADKSDNFVRAREARIAIDPSIEARTVAKASPDYKDALKSQSRLTMKTTRGDIIMDTHPTAPFTSHNFVTLAKQGKMDGMLWHRVIPNFVAQAGQKEDQSLYEWGSIREEWAAGTHSIGSVGVATAGKDTGGTQFFINTHRNLHLDGRYTVFAHVVEGMDIVYALQEGDQILSVLVEPIPEEQN